MAGTAGLSHPLPVLKPAIAGGCGTESVPIPAYAPLPPAAGVPVRALYVHVPFCTSKCHYCDFYSVAGHLDQVDAYLEALTREMTLQVAHFGQPRPQTIFIGGGTPTLLEPAKLQRLLD